MLVIVAATSTKLITPLLPAAQHFTISFTKVVGSLLGISMTSSEDILYTNGFPLRIAGECTALNYILILTLAILFYTRHSLIYRLSGIAVATGILLVVNPIRLIVIGLLGPVSLDLTHFVHEYVWSVIFALLVFFIWKVWADRRFKITGDTIKSIALAAVICTFTLLVLYRFKDAYSQVLTILAAPLYKLLSMDSHASVVWDNLLFYRHGQDSLQVGIPMDITSYSVYIGIMTPRLWHNRKAIPQAIVGLLVLLLMNVLLVALLGAIGMSYGYDVSRSFIFICSIIFLAFPLVMYWHIFSRKAIDTDKSAIESQHSESVPLTS